MSAETDERKRPSGERGKKKKKKSRKSEAFTKKFLCRRHRVLHVNVCDTIYKIIELPSLFLFILCVYFLRALLLEEVSPILSATSLLKAEAKRSASAEAPGASFGAISRSSMAILKSFSDGGESGTGGNCGG